VSPLAGKTGVPIPAPPQSALNTAALMQGQAAGWSEFIESARPLQGVRLLRRLPRSGCIVGHAEAIEVRLADDVVIDIRHF